MNSRSSTEPRVQRLRDRQRGETTAAILRAAEEAFSEQGLDAGMSDIAARAGVAVGTLYNHFSDRDALLDGLFDQKKREMIDQLDALPSNPDLRDELRGIVRVMFGCFDRNRAVFATVLMGGHSRLQMPSATAEAMKVRLEKVFKRALKKKLLKPRPARLYSVYLLGLIRGTLINQLAEERRELDEPVEDLLDLFLEGASR